MSTESKEPDVRTLIQLFSCHNRAHNDCSKHYHLRRANLAESNYLQEHIAKT